MANAQPLGRPGHLPPGPGPPRTRLLNVLDVGLVADPPTFVRRIAVGKPAPEHLEKGPLRVLLFTSLPDDLDAERGRLKVEEEQAQVQEALLPWLARGVVPGDGNLLRPAMHSPGDQWLLR